MTDKKLLGTGGENFAAAVLYAQGYDILQRNFRCRIGEIDIVCRKDDCIFFVEVKTRTSLIGGRPAEAVDPGKQRRMRGVASYYLMTHDLADCRVSFQVFEIMVNQIRDAF
ncbi:YraN family protein [Hornefia butyriciproducens]|uniref:YraN family protein n=1 Tax=Hornefia butyriciproducens TaxID=2652293 RepID=UPI003D0693C5